MTHECQDTSTVHWCHTHQSQAPEVLQVSHAICKAHSGTILHQHGDHAGEGHNLIFGEGMFKKYSKETVSGT